MAGLRLHPPTGSGSVPHAPGPGLPQAGAIGTLPVVRVRIPSQTPSPSPPNRPVDPVGPPRAGGRGPSAPVVHARGRRVAVGVEARAAHAVGAARRRGRVAEGVVVRRRAAGGVAGGRGAADCGGARVGAPAEACAAAAEASGSATVSDGTQSTRGDRVRRDKSLRYGVGSGAARAGRGGARRRQARTAPGSAASRSSKRLIGDGTVTSVPFSCSCRPPPIWKMTYLSPGMPCPGAGTMVKPCTFM